MGAWNVLSLLSSELKRLNIVIAALSELRRPDCGEIMAGGYTYNGLVTLMVTMPKELL